MLTMTITTSRYSIEDYLEMESNSLTKHEYWNGKIWEMAGGTDLHNEICARIIIEMGKALEERALAFKIYTSDMKIWIDKHKRFVYPDAVAIADKPVYYENRRDIITNPLLVVEVSSDGTQTYDLSSKFEQYRSIASFKEYLIISQTERMVTRYFREKENLWSTTDYAGQDAVISLQSMGLEIPLKGIYRGVDVP
jgi:Uma2 family endonuclease